MSINSFSNVDEVLIAYEQGTLDINARIRTVIDGSSNYETSWKSYFKSIIQIMSLFVG